MFNRPSFREMRLALRTVQAEAQLVLGLPEVEWPQNEYALFLMLGDMCKKMENPTRTQMLTMIATWLKFYKRLIDALPESDSRQTLTADFAKLSEPYQTLLEVQLQ